MNILPLQVFRFIKTGRILINSNCIINKSLNLWNTDVKKTPLNETLRYLHSCSRTLAPAQDTDSKKPGNPVIYYGSLTGQIKGVKVFTCLSSLGGIALQPLLVQNVTSGDNLPLAVALCSCVAFFTFVTPFLIHLLTKKYVIEIRYDSASDTYTATTLSFFLQRINMKFKLQDVTVPDWLPMFTTMCIKGKPVFVVSDCFLIVDHYIKMMGYDKPIDLNLSTSDNKEENAEEKVSQ